MYNTHMQIVTHAKNTINKYSMLSHGDSVLAGLSGGPDSVCLLSILAGLRAEYGIELSAAYIDHGFRPAETPLEIDFCRKLCGSLAVPFTAKAIEVKSFAKGSGLSMQEAARELRYRALEEAAASSHANKIALGHNADDQAETMLMRLIRGAGPAGISGIPPVRSHIIRPLIEIERTDIESYLNTGGISFVIDSSNLKNDYVRNRIRHAIMPAVKALNGNAVKAMSRSADIFRDEEKYFDIMVTKALMRLISRKTDAMIELFMAPLEAMDNVLLRRVLRRAAGETKGLRGVGFVHIEDMITLIKSGRAGDRIYIPGGLRIIRGYSTLVITSERPAQLGAYVLSAPGEVVLKEASLVLQCSIIDLPDNTGGQEYGDGRRTALLDADKAPFPLGIRPRLHGDYFYPLGFGKRKKIQDYFVDEKIPRDQRDSIPLLVHNNEIAWVVGHRADERYRIDKNSRRGLKCDIKPLKFL